MLSFEGSHRDGKDLVYERMAMRSRVFPTRKKEFDHEAGGGIYEKMLLGGAEARAGVDQAQLVFTGREGNNAGQGFDLVTQESRGAFRVFY